MELFLFAVTPTLTECQLFLAARVSFKCYTPFQHNLINHALIFDFFNWSLLHKISSEWAMRWRRSVVLLRDQGGLQTVVVLVAGLRGPRGGLAVVLDLEETENLEVIAPLVDLLLLVVLSLMGGRSQGLVRAAGTFRDVIDCTVTEPLKQQTSGQLKPLH